MLRRAAVSLSAAAVSVFAFVLVAVFTRLVTKPRLPITTSVGQGFVLIVPAIIVVAVVVMAVCGSIATLLTGRTFPRWATVLARLSACILTAAILQMIAIRVFGDANDPATVTAYLVSWTRRPLSNGLALVVYALPATIFLRWIERECCAPPGRRRTNVLT